MAAYRKVAARGAARRSDLYKDLGEQRGMSGASSSAAEASRLLREGRYEEALPFAERAVAGAHSCMLGHGLLASVLLQLGRAAEA